MTAMHSVTLSRVARRFLGAFYEKLGYRVFGMPENHPAGPRHYFMTKRL